MVTGTTATLAVTGSGTTYDVTASGGNLADLDATVTLGFASGQDIEDMVGNAFVAPTGPSPATYVVDNTAPTVAITGVPGASNAPFTATFTFSEDVTGFVVGDIMLVNAGASVFTDTNAPVYTALITPTTDGAVTVNVAAGVAEDLAGNANTVALQATSIYTAPDTTAPTVTSITRQSPTSSPTREDSLTWQVTFSEDVTNVDAADFTVTGTSATPAVTGSGTTYSVTVSGGNLADLTATVTLAFDSNQNIQDTEGNPLATTTPAGTNENDYGVDNTAPTVAITGVPGTSAAPFTATVTFSEAVTGFVLGDIRLGNATASNFVDTNAPVYTALITPTTDGAVTVNVAAGVAEDLAGNANTVALQATSIYTAPDTTAPTVTSITRQSPTSSPTREDSLTWQVTFSEEVTNVDAADFTVTGTSATPAVTGSGTTYSVTVSGGNLADLTATVTLAFDSNQNIQDTEGNPLATTTPAGTNENDYGVDNTAPTVEITDVPTTSNVAFTATFTFSEDVTGFVLSDIALDNATASNFTDTNAPVYTALITPEADGEVTVDVAAGVATDAAGNANTVAHQASSTYDTTAPTVTSIVRQDPSSTPTHEDRLTWQVTFSEAVTNVNAADFSMTGTTATVTVTGRRDDVRRHRERGRPGRSQRQGGYPVLCQRPGHRGRGGQCADRHDPHGHERERLRGGQHRAHGGDHRRADHQPRGLHGDLHLLGGCHGICPERHHARQCHGLELHAHQQRGLYGADHADGRWRGDGGCGGRCGGGSRGQRQHRGEAGQFDLQEQYRADGCGQDGEHAGGHGLHVPDRRFHVFGRRYG